MQSLECLHCVRSCCFRRHRFRRRRAERSADLLQRKCQPTAESILAGSVNERVVRPDAQGVAGTEQSPNRTSPCIPRVPALRSRTQRAASRGVFFWRGDQRVRFTGGYKAGWISGVRGMFGSKLASSCRAQGRTQTVTGAPGQVKKAPSGAPFPWLRCKVNSLPSGTMVAIALRQCAS